MLISSPGGHVESGDAIHDMIRFVRAPVTTIGSGWVASAGAHIFLAGAKDRRFCRPNTRFLLHQPAGGARGMAADIEIEAREILRNSPGCLVIDKQEPGGYVTPYEAAGEDATYISRIREDATVENGLSFWCVSDNLRKGAALNAVQIAETMIERGMIGGAKRVG